MIKIGKRGQKITTANRLGEVRENKYGTKMKIIAYRKSDDIDVQFLDEHGYVFEHQIYSNFKLGGIRNPYDKTVYGVGYLGEGKYKVYIDQDHLEPVYNVWRTLLGRVCTEKHRKQFPAYVDCEVCEEWLCYQNFAEWWNKNMYHIGTERMHLDKDILIKGNKVYSPDTCLIVPQSINEIFHSSGKKKKDADLPHTIIRVARGRFSVSYRGKSLGVYDTVEEASDVYLKEKRDYIKQKVESMENELPDKVKEALLAW